MMVLAATASTSIASLLLIMVILPSSSSCSIHTPKLEILDFGSGLKSQKPGAGKECHRNLVSVPDEIP
jgi:hypothetical protein